MKSPLKLFIEAFDDEGYEALSAQYAEQDSICIGGKEFLPTHISRATNRKTTMGITQILRAPDQPWTGEGLPPAGTFCEGQVKNGGKWQKYTILASTPQHLVVKDEFEAETPIRHIYWEFRPIRTAEQIAAEERLALELAACSDIDGELERFNVTLECSAAIRATINAMLEKGYRKQVQP